MEQRGIFNNLVLFLVLFFPLFVLFLYARIDKLNI